MTQTITPTNNVIDLINSAPIPLFPMFAGNMPSVDHHCYSVNTVELSYCGAKMLRLLNCIFKALSLVGGEVGSFFQMMDDLAYIDPMGEVIGAFVCTFKGNKNNDNRFKMFEKVFTEVNIGNKIKQFLLERGVYPNGENSRFTTDGVLILDVGRIVTDGFPYDEKDTIVMNLTEKEKRFMSIKVSILDMAIIADILCGTDKATMGKYDPNRVDKLSVDKLREEVNPIGGGWKEAHRKQIIEERYQTDSKISEIKQKYKKMIEEEVAEIEQQFKEIAKELSKEYNDAVQENLGQSL